jgi:hypothetical protein
MTPMVDNEPEDEPDPDEYIDLEGPRVIQCVGAEKCRFPLVACEWRVEPGGAEVQYNGLKGESPRGAMKRCTVSVQEALPAHVNLLEAIVLSLGQAYLGRG